MVLPAAACQVQESNPYWNKSKQSSILPLTDDRQTMLAARILTCPGPYAPVRSVQRRNGSYSSVDIAKVMNSLTVDRTDPNYVGELKEVSHESRPIRVFYKCPPEKVSEEALAQFGISHSVYVEAFQEKAKSYLPDLSKDILYRDMMERNSPFLTKE